MHATSTPKLEMAPENARTMVHSDADATFDEVRSSARHEAGCTTSQMNNQGCGELFLDGHVPRRVPACDACKTRLLAKRHGGGV